LLSGRAAYLSAIEHRAFTFIILRQSFACRPADLAIGDLLLARAHQLGYAQKYSIYGYRGIRHGSDGKWVYVYYRKRGHYQAGHQLTPPARPRAAPACGRPRSRARGRAHPPAGGRFPLPSADKPGLRPPG